MIETILNLLFRKVDIATRARPGNDIYLRRWFLYPRNPPDLKMIPRIYLHKFYEGDEISTLHDHPWRFTSIILKGGYWEHSLNPDWIKQEESHKIYLNKVAAIQKEVNEKGIDSLSQGDWDTFWRSGLVIATYGNNFHKYRKKWYGPGSILRRGASWAHAVELPTGKDGKPIKCWSIVRTSAKVRSWGFHTDKGWCYWKNYENGACVCYDVPEEKLYK